MPSIKRAFDYILHNRAQFMDSCVKNLGFMIPDKLYLSLRYRCIMGSWINWKNPQTFTEKLQWLKLYNRKPEYTKMVDKYAVKEYVAKKIGEEYIIPTLGVWDKPEDIDWDSLPNQFVLKTTHGGGGGGVVICKDKTTFDKASAIAKLKESMASEIYSGLREWPYKNVPKRIIAEKFMAPEKSPAPKDLLDFKFFCFNGEPKFLYVSDTPSHSLTFLNTDWTITDFGRDDYHPLNKIPEKPENLEEMLTIASKLSAGIPHVRVDLYNIDKHIFFGELTLFTGSGFIPFNPKEFDGKLGDLLTLPNAIGGGKYLIAKGEITELKTEYDELKDYKFFCFNGKVKFFKVDFGRFVEHHANYYDTDGNLLPFGEKSLEPDPNYIIELPNNLKEMISLAERLSKNEPFLRVDFYNVEGKIYFGELTFYPASGMIPWTTEEADNKIGKYLKL